MLPTATHPLTSWSHPYEYKIADLSHHSPVVSLHPIWAPQDPAHSQTTIDTCDSSPYLSLFLHPGLHPSSQRRHPAPPIVIARAYYAPLPARRGGVNRRFAMPRPVCAIPQFVLEWTRVALWVLIAQYMVIWYSWVQQTVSHTDVGIGNCKNTAPSNMYCVSKRRNNHRLDVQWNSTGR